MINRNAFGTAAARIAVPALISLTAATAYADFTSSSNSMPSLDSVYVQANDEVYSTALGQVVLSHLHLSPNSGGAPPPDLGVTLPAVQFGGQARATISAGGSPPQPVDFSCVGTMSMTCVGGGGGLGTFQTEMLQLDLIGSAPGVMIRESPTKQSLGSCTIAPDGGGGYRIGSFFDVFTELSLDGGQTWTPSGEAPMRFAAEQATPEPASMAAIGLGVIALIRKRRK